MTTRRRISPVGFQGVGARPGPPRSVVRGEPGAPFKPKNLQNELISIVVREAFRRCARVESRAKVLISGEMVNVRTGRLRSSIRSVIGISRDGTHVSVVGRVGTNVKYGRYLHQGTGIYGPRHQRIRPVRARVLAFPGEGGEMVFRASVAGVRPRPFLRRALRETAGGTHP